MNDKERLEEIKKVIDSQKESIRKLGVNDINWLIEQAEKMIKVREIYENGGEAWQDDAEDVIFDRGEANE